MLRATVSKSPAESEGASLKTSSPLPTSLLKSHKRLDKEELIAFQTTMQKAGFSSEDNLDDYKPSSFSMKRKTNLSLVSKMNDYSPMRIKHYKDHYTASNFFKFIKSSTAIH